MEMDFTKALLLVEGTYHEREEGNFEDEEDVIKIENQYITKITDVLH